MVWSIRQAEKAKGKLTYELTSQVRDSRKFGRSLFAIKDINEGEIFSNKNIRSIRPGYGLHPKFYFDIIGKKANLDIKRGTPLRLEFIRQSN
jgi:pseudaminic acid synthase